MKERRVFCVSEWERRRFFSTEKHGKWGEIKARTVSHLYRIISLIYIDYRAAYQTLVNHTPWKTKRWNYAISRMINIKREKRWMVDSPAYLSFSN